MARKKVRLPRIAQQYLRTVAGRWCRSALTIFHRWMSERSLELADLTPVHLDQFWQAQQARGITTASMHVRRCRIHKYLYWLQDKEQLRFDVDPPRLSHVKTPLPASTRRFLARRGDRVLELLVRNFHDWLRRRHIALHELTPLHIEAFLKRPIAKTVTRPSRKARRSQLNPYLQWLTEQGLAPPGLDTTAPRPFPLPGCALAFVDSLRPTRKAETCSGYLGDLRDLHAWIAAQAVSLDGLDRGAAERWMKALADRGLGPSTRGQRIIHARSYFRWLLERGEVTADPDELFRATDLPKLPIYLPRPLPVEADRELQRRLLESDDLYHQALFLMRRSGVRIGELVRLERRCLDDDPHGNVYLKVPLGKLDNERLVPLDEEARHVAEGLQGRCPSSAPFLLRPECSRGLLKSYLQAALKTAADGLDIPGPVVSHRLRHSYATELLNAGMSLISIMKLLGHRSIRMTMRYAAVTQDTVVRDYYAAMETIAAQYQMPIAVIGPGDLDPHAGPDPDRMLRDLVSFLRNHVTDADQAHRLISRVYKLRYEIAQLQPAKTEL